MTTSPPTDQQLDEIEALTKNIPAGPWTVDDSRAELRGSHGNLLADLWDDRLGAYFAAMHAATPALLAEIRRLKQQRRYLLGVLTRKDAASGAGDRALTEFLAAEEPFTAEELAAAQADVEHLNAEFDPTCDDENDGDWCELEPGHEGHHRADTVEWTGRSAASSV